jgi:hypothetical protein
MCQDSFPMSDSDYPRRSSPGINPCPPNRERSITLDQRMGVPRPLGRHSVEYFETPEETTLELPPFIEPRHALRDATRYPDGV